MGQRCGGEDGDRLPRHVLSMCNRQGKRAFWPEPVGEGEGYGLGLGTRVMWTPGLILVEELRLTIWP